METDVFIIGAGPAGISCGLMLVKSGLRITIADKSTFPREKICGDALSGNVINTLKRFPDNIYGKFLKEFEHKIPSFGIKIFSPDSKSIEIPFPLKDKEIPGFLAKRIDFDNFLFQQLKNYPDIKIIENCLIDKVITNDEQVIIHSADKTFKAKILVVANGINSNLVHSVKNTSCTALRTYYSNIKGFNEGNFIELYFFKKILPGYFWIFPMDNNLANVGIGILSSKLRKKGKSLKEIMQMIIDNEPVLKDRFKDAVKQEEPKAYNLPLFSVPDKISGNRFLMIGDAASLTDPFTGEGVGNALYSGRIASEHILKCFDKNIFSAEFNADYDKYLYSKLLPELKLSKRMQKLSNYPFLFNFIVSKANKNEKLYKLIISMMNNMDIKKSFFKNPLKVFKP